MTAAFSFQAFARPGAAMCVCAINADEAPERPAEPQYVTLDQAAALVNRSKRALQKYIYEPLKVKRYAMPDPAIEGGGGRPAEWEWSVLRPWLERVFGRSLPACPPNWSSRRPA